MSGYLIIKASIHSKPFLLRNIIKSRIFFFGFSVWKRSTLPLLLQLRLHLAKSGCIKWGGVETVMEVHHRSFTWFGAFIL